MTRPKTDLARLATVAQDQGRTAVAAVCRAALHHIDDLEAQLQRIKGNARRGALTRLNNLTPAQRTILAKRAAQQRWHPDHASG